MNRVLLWCALAVVTLGLSLQAQQFRYVRKPGEPMPLPDPEIVKQQLETAGSQLVAKPPALVCTSVAARNHLHRSTITVDFTGAPLPSADWDRFKNDEVYRGFVETRDLPQQQVDLAPIFQELFRTDAKFSVVGRVGVNRHLATEVKYSEADRDTRVFVDWRTGAILRIVLRDFETPQGVAALVCRPR